MADKTTSSPVVMTASGTNSPSNQATTPKKAAAPKSKKPRSKPTHPRTSEMVNAAIKALKERAGSSLQAIKKYIASTYKVDAEKHAPFIRKYLKSAVASGILVQTKGKGAAGSFRLASAKLEPTKSKIQQSASKSAASKKPAAILAAPKKPAPAKKTAKRAATTKKTPAVAVSEKRKTAKGPAAKPPKAKTTTPKSKTVAKAPAKKAQTKKAAAAAKTKKSVSKKTSTKKK